jgi:glycosyltransferase involved in cell wall biosynthesis
VNFPANAVEPDLIGPEDYRHSGMKISVILCTYNRCQILPKALESIAASRLAESVPWDVLVVDNNSTDATRKVVEDFCARHPSRFQYLFEPKQGKSNALNTGIRRATGDVLAFTDDDITVAPTWLANLTAPLEFGKWSSAGGRIHLANDFRCPSWLGLEGECSLGGVLGFFDRGDEPREFTEPFWGGNVAYRRDIFDKYGFYRVDLGRTAGEMLSNEDTELSGRILAAGERLWYEPSAVVYHAVPYDRLSKGYFLKFGYDQGRSRVRETANRPDILGIPRWCFSIPLTVFRMLIPRMRKWLFSRNPKERFFYKWAVWGTVGMIVELPRAWAEQKRRTRKADRRGIAGNAKCQE